MAALCAAAPEDGAKSAPRLVAYFFSASDLAISPLQTFSSVATTSAGTPLGTNTPK